MGKPLASALILLASLAAYAQELPVYGELSELKDLRRVYITADRADARERVLREVKKYSGLEVVNAPEAADFLLVYAVKAQTDEGLTSQLSAVIKMPDGRQRVLWEETERSGGGKPNSVNLTRHFVKALKKVRDKK